MQLLRWIFITGGAIGLGTLIELVGLPGSHFFGGVIIGIVVALFGFLKKTKVPNLAFDLSLTVTGVVLGCYVTHEAIHAVIMNVMPILVISLGTLGISLWAGFLLARMSEISLPTALLGMLAGGSAMNVVVSDKIKADVRLVTLMHLLRLLLVLILTPILIHFFLSPQTHLSIFVTGTSETISPFVQSFIITCVLALIGWFVAIKLPYSGSLILTPLIIAMLFNLYGPFPGMIPPEGFREFAAMIIGLQVGMRFDKEILRSTRKYIPIVIFFMLFIIAGCGAFAWFLTLYTPFNFLTSYLATTPGGRTTVVALSFTTGANTTVVLAIQTLRLLIMTLFAPPAISYLVNRKIKLSSNPENVLD